MKKRLDEILLEIGMTQYNYWQLRYRGVDLPHWVEQRANTRGRGAEYLYDEDEVKKVVKDHRERVASGLGSKKGPMPLPEKVKIILGKGPKTRKMLMKELGIDSSSHRLYGKLNITLNALMDDGDVVTNTGAVGSAQYYYLVTDKLPAVEVDAPPPPPPPPPGKSFEQPEPVEQIELKPKTIDGKKPSGLPEITI